MTQNFEHYLNAFFMRKTLTTLSLSTLFLTACGHVGNAVVSDKALQEKAAFALSTTTDKVTISDRRATMDSIQFVATVGKNSHQCYITTIAGGISSDALCSGASSASNKPCDELSRKAGRCQ